MTEPNPPENSHENGVFHHPVDYSRVTLVCGIAIAAIGILGIMGLFLSLSSFSSIISRYKPIAFSAALVWIFFGLVLAGLAQKPLQGRIRTVLAAVLGLIIGIQLFEFPINLLGDHFFIETASVQASSLLMGIATTPISPVTSGLILPAGVSLLILLYAPELSGKYPRIRDISGILGIIVLFVSFVFILSYLYGAPFFYDSSIIPISLPSALALALCGLGLATAAGPAAAPLRYFTGNSTHAQLLRAFIPLTLAIILIDELLHIGLRAFTSVNDALVLALVISIFTLVTVIVVGRVARHVSRKIDHAEIKRRGAETELRAAYEQLAAQEEELRLQFDDLSRNQTALLERDVQYRTILQTAMDGFCVVDLQGAFLDVNDAFCSMLDYTRDEMLTLSLPDIEVKESDEMIDIHMKEILRKGSDRFETRYRCKDGRIIDTEVSVVYTGLQGAPFITFHRDITEQNRANKAHEQSKKKLNLLNSVTFKDIGNAIFSLGGFVQLIKGELTDKKLSGFMDRIEDSVVKITHSLEFAHSYQDMGMKPPRWQDVNHIFLLAISHQNFSTVRHSVKMDGLEVYADPLFEKALENLAKNSFIHGGTITQVSLGYAMMPDKSLKIIYTDDGHGIAADLKPGIFTRDFPLKKGMDLFLVREILEITGMSIVENGEPGRGARFEISVPHEGYRFREPGIPNQS